MAGKPYIQFHALRQNRRNPRGEPIEETPYSAVSVFADTSAVTEERGKLIIMEKTESSAKVSTVKPAAENAVSSEPPKQTTAGEAAPQTKEAAGAKEKAAEEKAAKKAAKKQKKAEKKAEKKSEKKAAPPDPASEWLEKTWEESPNGFRIEYSKSEDFSGSKKEKITKRKDLKKLAKKLKKAKKCYARVRAYSGNKDEKYSSDWSEATSLKP